MNIYIIKNTINDKVYIGQTSESIQRRFNRHKKDCYKSAPVYVNNKFYRAMRKLGPENFFIELIEDNISTFEELDRREIYWISKYDSYYNGYNSTLGGQHYKPSYNDKVILELWNEGKSISQISKELSLDRETISRALKRQDIIDTTIHQYSFIYSDEQLLEWWRQGLGVNQISELYGGNNSTIKKRLINNCISEQEIQQRAHANRKISQKNNAQLLKISICQFSLEGKLLQTFSSIQEASYVTKIDRSDISHCLTGDYITSGNYIWLYESDKDKINNKLKKLKKNKKEVMQFDLQHNYLQTYDSIAAATRAVGGKSSSSISGKCNAGGGVAYGYYWKFNEEEGD